MPYQVQVLLDRAIALERAGQWQFAIEICEEAFRTAWAAGDAAKLAEALLRMGYSYHDLGQEELATEYYRLTYETAHRTGEQGIAGRALNGLAILLQQHGELAAATERYLQARELVVAARDSDTAGNISQNLGTLANIRGELASALDHYRTGLRCYEATGNQHGMAAVLNNLGMLYTDLRELEEAASCLDRALELCRATEDVVTEGIVYANRTELFIARGDLRQARENCDNAFEISRRIGDHSVEAEALKFSGIIYREEGKLHLSELHLHQAIRVATRYKNPLSEAESRRELALVLRAQERNREALQALNAAHTLFTELQANPDLADVNQRVAQLEEDFLAVVSVWGESIEAKDRYTRGHCSRVAAYACRIAERAGIPQRDMVWFRMGAFLHDVGKTDTPAEILNKPGHLTREERRIIEQHTVIGDEILSAIPFPWDIRPMVRGHHERWDGGGYPDGLRGEEIHFTARILRLADIFDALTTTRSYREPLTPAHALQLMEADRGSFDPELFEIFRELHPELSAMVGGELPPRDPPE